MWTDAERRTDITSVERWDLLHTLQHFIEHTASWILRHRPAPLDVIEEIARYRPGVRELVAGRPRPATIAQTTEQLRFLAEALALIETARQRGCPVEAAAAVHTRVDTMLELNWVTNRLEDHVTTNWWDAMAAATVRDDLAERHHALVGAILDSDSEDQEHVRVWEERVPDAIHRFTRIIAELRRDGVVDVSRACTAGAELKLLVKSTLEDSLSS